MMAENGKAWLAGGVLAAMAVTLVACGTETTGVTTPAAQDSTEAPSAPELSDHVKLRDGSGAVVAEIKAKEYGFKLYDGAGTEWGKLKLDDGRWKLKDAAGATLFKLKPKDQDSFKMSDGADAVVFRAKVRSVGIELYDGNEALFATLVRPAPGGSWLARDPAGATLGTASVRDGGHAVADPAGKTLFTVTGASSESGLAALAVARLTLQQRLALYCYLRVNGW